MRLTVHNNLKHKRKPIPNLSGEVRDIFIESVEKKAHAYQRPRIDIE